MDGKLYKTAFFYFPQVEEATAPFFQKLTIDISVPEFEQGTESYISSILYRVNHPDSAGNNVSINNCQLNLNGSWNNNSSLAIWSPGVQFSRMRFTMMRPDDASEVSVIRTVCYQNRSGKEPVESCLSIKVDSSQPDGFQVTNTPLSSEVHNKLTVAIGGLTTPVQSLPENEIEF